MPPEEVARDSLILRQMGIGEGFAHLAHEGDTNRHVVGKACDRRPCCPRGHRQYFSCSRGIVATISREDVITSHSGEQNLDALLARDGTDEIGVDGRHVRLRLVHHVDHVRQEMQAVRADRNFPQVDADMLGDLMRVRKVIRDAFLLGPRTIKTDGEARQLPAPCVLLSEGDDRAGIEALG